MLIQHKVAFVPLLMRHPAMRSTLLLLLLATSATAGTFTVNRPTTTNNDDSCDISVMPAATLLLPYFKVDINAPVAIAETTVFTIINTTELPQIARVTIWTDVGYPLFAFNIFLTGYDVQAINMYDVVGRGVMAPERGTSTASTPGRRSLSNGSNPNFFSDALLTCSPAVQPVEIPRKILTDIQAALTRGTYGACGDIRIGTTHREAIGYATIDVVATCSYWMPDDPSYFNELLYDNVLGGDYQQIAPYVVTGNYASANPLVHIRAIPEGGPAGVATETFLPYTFYDRLTPRATPRMDRRQPLPATFVARWIEGGPSSYRTDLQIWREGRSGVNATCSDYARNEMPFTDVVRFDERENATAYAPTFRTPLATLPLASRSDTGAEPWRTVVPAGGEVAGWLYLNLHNGEPRSSQNWVSMTMFAAGQFSVAMDATSLANGCTAAPQRGTTIAPAEQDVP